MSFTKGVGFVCAFQLLFLCTAISQPVTFSFTRESVNVMEHISNLKLARAKILLAEEKSRYPKNAALDYLGGCIDYYTLITNPDPALFNILEKDKSARLSRIQKLPASSPYKLYAEAELHLHWSILKLNKHDYLSGALELREAYQLLEKNNTLFPAFLPTKKSLGFVKALLGTLPENYAWILNIVGLKGNYDAGLKIIQQYLNQKKFPEEQLLDKQQADFYYTLLHVYFGNKQTAWEYCEPLTRDYTSNLLSCYLRSFIASRTAHTDEAIMVLSKRPRGTEYAPFDEMDFTMGYAKLNRLDDDGAIFLKKYVTFARNNGKKKDAYRRLAWHHLLAGDTSKYVVYKHLSYKQNSAKDDEDKYADRDLEAGIYPNQMLLKARLLFDGGYYEPAERVIAEVKTGKLHGKYQQAEYYYRYGRIMQEQKKYSKAIEYFTQSIKLAEPLEYYMAPYSALQIGHINMKLGFTQTAKYYFEKAMAYKNYDARNYIHQKAKLALQEIK
ncbi:MAG: hypothetical protein V4590_14885 [Bacteroidota bacterium]